MRRIARCAAAAALCAAAALSLSLGRRPSPPHAASPLAQAALEPASGAAPEPPAGLSVSGPLSPALRDTDVDGDLTSDARGDLVVTPEVRRFFDYFLIAWGDVAPDALRARIVAEIRKRLPERAAAEAVDLLDRYFDYRRRAAALDSGPGSDVEARLAALWDLRREVLGTRNAVAMFGAEEDATRAALERQRIEGDPRLSDAEKDGALEDAEARLPDDERKARADAISAVKLWNDEQALRAQGASAEQIRQLRLERVGPEATSRLEALDQERATFQSALDQSRALQSALAANAALSDTDRTSALQQWVAQHFPAEEQTHAGVLLGLSAAN